MVSIMHYYIVVDGIVIIMCAVVLCIVGAAERDGLQFQIKGVFDIHRANEEDFSV